MSTHRCEAQIAGWEGLREALEDRNDPLDPSAP
jgi:hypothetical protein